MRYLILLLICLGASAASADATRNDPQLGAVRAALDGIERGNGLDAATLYALDDHPLRPWLEYAELRHQLGRASDADVRTLLDRHAALPFAEPLRRAWLGKLAKRRDWPTFLRHYRETDAADISLRCHAFSARLAAGQADEALLSAITDTWRHGASRPDACDGAFAALAAAGRIDDALRWQRIVLAAQEGNNSLMRYLARALPATDKALAESYAGFLDAADSQAAAWPRNERSQAVALSGLNRLSRRDPAAAQRLLDALAPRLLDGDQADAVRYQIALWSAASYLPGSAQRFAAVPAAAYDARLHEWRVREALARSAWDEALHGIEAMSAEQRTEPRWRYLEARMREQTGDAAAARALFATLAREAHYHGFLAADRLGLDYALCPQEIPADAALRQRIAELPGLVRAVRLFALDRRAWADLEWRAVLATLDADERRVAAAIALDAHWYDRAVFALTGPDDLAYYSLRFPLPQRQAVRREARRHDLDESWVSALIRAESAWQSDARSSANARGLMQLLPGTAAATAKQLGKRWGGANSLYAPNTNIELGTAYLRAMLDRHGGQPHLATAAYNAGPAPVGRWLAQRAGHDVDLWIETIPYRETREYVARIMAFSVIHDWRLRQDKATALSDRLRGASGPATRGFACPGAPVTETPAP
ncbi:MAG: transglycosylase SLT domain-containing protein [Lysobacteraceae bacterium]